jgi:membrane protein DedA with SNARE-associated domain
VDPLLDWLETLAPATLYTVLALVALGENLFPPFPSDIVLAFGSFIGARGSGTALGIFAATWTGNVSGAMIVYGLGRRYGAQRLERRLAGEHAESRHAKLRLLFHRYGMLAVFVSRFVPGVRAVVPAFAGALRLPVFRTATMMGSASAVWYGFITYVAFRVGADWPQFRAMIAQYSRTAALVATLLLAVGIAVWLLVRRRQKTN